MSAIKISNTRELIHMLFAAGVRDAIIYVRDGVLEVRGFPIDMPYIRRTLNAVVVPGSSLRARELSAWQRAFDRPYKIETRIK